MKCGEEIQVRDLSGSNVMRFIAQCHDRYLLIMSSPLDYRNGYMLHGWAPVLRELIAVAVPDKMTERIMMVQSAPSGLYAAVPLTYPLSVRGLASVFGVDPDSVRAELENFAVKVIE